MIENIKARLFAKRFNIWKEEIDANDKEGYFIYNKQIYFGNRFFVFIKSNQILFRLDVEEENKNLYADVDSAIDDVNGFSLAHVNNIEILESDLVELLENQEQEEKELNNTFPKVVDVYITMDNGDELRVYKKADTVQMEKQEEDKTSLKYYESKVMRFVIHNRNTDATFLFDAFEEAKKMYEIEIAKAYEKGYQDAIKFYNQFEK